MSDTTSIDQEIDRELLGLLHARVSDEFAQAQMDLNEAQKEVDRLWDKLSRIEERMVEATRPITRKTEIVGEGGRVKKGLSDKLIADFLKAANGVGANMEQITTATSTTTSTARRTINKLIEEKKIEVLSRGRWKWKTELPAEKDKEKGGAT